MALTRKSRAIHDNTRFGVMSLSKPERGQSEVLALALLVGMIVISSTLLASFAVTEFNEHETGLSISQAERALDKLDADTSSVALGEATAKQSNLGLAGADGNLDLHEHAGWMNITATHPVDDDKLILNKTLGAVEYSNRQATIGYQAGGQWRLQNGNAVVQSPPAFQFQEDTLVINVISLTGDSAIYSNVQVRKAGGPTRHFPDPVGIGLENKMQGRVLDITVHSRYYEAWADFFRSETHGVVSVDHQNQTATLELPTTPSKIPINNGIVITSATSELRVEGTTSIIDGYNSTEGPYSVSEKDVGNVQTVGNVTIKGNNKLEGNLTSEGLVSLQGANKPKVTRDVQYGIEPAPPDDQVGGNRSKLDKDLEEIDQINYYVENGYKRIEGTNDNAAESEIANDEIVSGGTLAAGSYHLNKLELSSGETLELDTTNGVIELAVRDYVRIENAELNVTGPNHVRIFAPGENATSVNIPGDDAPAESNFHVGKGGNVNIPGQVSTKLRVYGPTPFKATVSGSNGAGNRAEFDGILYAPSGRNGTGHFWIDHGDFHGVVATGTITANNKGNIRFDEAASGTIVNPGPGFLAVEYLHVSHRNVTITAK